MDLENLFYLQSELDVHISSEHNLDNEDLFDKKVLALLVELGEFANETRCFKFWSKKGPSEKAVMLEEYVDGLHFILSLGLIKEYTYINLVLNRNVISDGTDGFLTLYNKSLNFKINPTEKNYENMFQCFLDLGSFFGFTGEDIENAYLEKNKVNHKRQEQGY